MKGRTHTASRARLRDAETAYDSEDGIVEVPEDGMRTHGEARHAPRRLRVVPRRDGAEQHHDPLQLLSDELEALSGGTVTVEVGRARPLSTGGPLAGRGRRSQRMLVAGDLLAVALAFVIAFAAGLGRDDSPAFVAVVGLLALAGGSFAAQLYGMYGRDAGRTDHTTADDLPHVFHVALLVSFGTVVLLAIPSGSVRLGPTLLLFVALFALMSVCRGGARALHRRDPGFIQNTVIVGTGSVGQLLALKLINRPVHGYRLAGFVDDDAPDSIEAGLDEVPLLGAVHELPELVDRYDIDRVIVAFSRHSHERTVELLASLKRLDVYVDVVPRLFDALGPTAALHSIDGLPLIGHPRSERSQSSRTAKRVLDLAGASIGAVLLSPVLVLIALLVKFDSPGPALYSADRIGRDGRRFRQLKFRTMRREFCDGDRYGGEGAKAAFARLLAENEHMRREFEQTHKLGGDPRVTRIGRFLRATSLDELPQLLNVIRGDLSLVGPRPVTEAELERYGDGVDELLSVPPGLTGFWQISGRSALSYDERVRLDLAYVNAWSLRLDLQILLKSANLLTKRTRAV